jgi:predicted DsbA family dithiol-disulfide isomerase
MSAAGESDKEHGPPVARGRGPGDIERVRTGVPDGGKRLVLFADYVCPFCFLAEAVTTRLEADGVVVERAAFELRPAGTPLPDLDAGWMREAWLRSVEPLAAELDVMMTRPSIATRTRKPHEAAAYARSEGMLPAMHAAIYAAYWQEGRDIGRIDVLVDIGRSVGLDPGGLRVALDIDQWTERVEQDEAWAADLGLGGVPAWVRADAGGAAFAVLVGLQRYEELTAWMKLNDI